ncbi:MAG: ABC transporter ATP-binding protein [Fusobacterium perfoetens]|uniref:ABC transporter ATP-binding protein n=1 Tax=Fusobacterium perfoetens TaxID=852 RepID=UPI0023F47B01|nr:ABC transporter ATP-binding protein [Fusobacterium perfoetens]MCI6153206.1 ABC transporter ATP-binding protein [Fusobacterium perfoetens]MDY3238307.1 ABC transporter ATP-binding protein [Fusobacterium perfoetens]
MNKFILKNLNKKFQDKEIFKNINLEINSDEITVILGKSGCGKTTLLRILGSLDKDFSGDITFLKNNIEVFNFKIGFVFQESRLMPWLTVEKNIKLHDKENKISTSDVDKFLSLVSLENCKNLFPNQLSGGMSNRVSIARALSYNPDILLMDEPFSALDYFTRKNLQKVIVEVFKNTNKGIIFVTHDIDEALAIANKILVINHKNFYEFSLGNNLDRDIDSIKFLDIKKEIKKLLE